MMKSLIHLICFATIPIGATSQIAKYTFESTLEDQINAHHALFLVDGQVAQQPLYSADGIALDTISGIEFPSSLKDAVDTTQSLEISFTFRVTDIGSGRGFKDLWSCQPHINDSGMSIFVRHDEFSTREDFQIIFSYADGGFNLGVPDHPGHDETQIGTHLKGELVEVRLIIDFQLRTWSSNVNGNYISRTFDTQSHEWSKIRESLKKNRWFFGWHQGQMSDAQWDPDIWTASVDLDEITFYSPRQAGDVNQVIVALREMTGHADGSAPLSQQDREHYLNILYLNYFKNHDLVADEVLEYIRTHEANYPPLFQDRVQRPLVDLSPEDRLLFFLQQSLFDHEYTLASVEEMEGVIFEFSEVFPGPVRAEATRVENALVEIDGTHSYEAAARVVEDLTDAQRPLGYYAAPGEIVTINISPTHISAGLSVMIGAHDDDISSRSVRNRFNRMSKTYPLNAASTKIISPFGGGLYLKVPIGSAIGWIDIQVSGAVKSPYFSWRAGRRSSPAVWSSDIAKHEVEWVDLESDRYMMTMPLAHMSTIADPTQLMMIWDSIMAGYRYVGGRPHPRPRTEYFLVDSQLPSDAFGTGYPQVIGEDLAPFGPFNTSVYYPTHVLNPEFWDSDVNTTFHEMGHAVLHPTLIEEVESIVHIPAAYIYNTIFDLPIDDAFKFSSQEFLSLNEAAMDWMIAYNFRNNNDMGCDPTMEDLVCHELRYQHRGFAKYVDMARLLGWQTVFAMNHVFYDAWTSGGVEELLVTKDNVLRAASQASNLNLAPLFHFWGHAPSPALREEISSLPTSAEILSQLIAYYDLVPGSQSEFAPYRDRLLARKDPVHYDRINLAHEEYGSQDYPAQIRDQICHIIDLYYPTSNFCELANTDAQMIIDQDCILFRPDSINDTIKLAGNFENYLIRVLRADESLYQDLTGSNSPLVIDPTALPDGLYFINVTHLSNENLSVQRTIKNE